MKHIILILPFFLSFYVLKSQNDSITKNPTLLFINFGLNGTVNNREGFHIGMSFGKEKHFLHLQHIQNSNWEEKSGTKHHKLGIITSIKSYALTYNYKWYRNEVFNLIPSIGLIWGKENYRLNKSEVIPGTGGLGVGGLSSTSPSLKFFYENNYFIGLKTSLKLYTAPSNMYAGFYVEPYVFVNNLKRVDFGLSFGMLIGKIY